MTALTKYERLESPGLWRDSPNAQRREVVVGLREATLVLSDPKTEMALTQWSLPASHRLNPGQMPALFAPADDGGEDLEIDDADMIAALGTVRKALERRKAHPGRLRAVVLGGAALAVVAVVVFWLPGKVKDYAASVLPPPTREALGDLALADLSRLTGQPCKSVTGRRAATELAARLFPEAPPRIEVLREGLTAPAHLPGDILLLPAAVIEGGEGPDVVAGHLLDEALRAGGDEPVMPVLEHMGVGATLRLLTTGVVADTALQGFGEAFLATPRAPLPAMADLTAAFKAAGVSSALYGEALRKAEPAAQGLIDNDPFPLGAPAPLMTDETWLELQAICAE